MLRTLMLCAAASVAIGLAHPTFAQGQFGTAAEAKAMLEKAVAGGGRFVEMRCAVTRAIDCWKPAIDHKGDTALLEPRAKERTVTVAQRMIQDCGRQSIMLNEERGVPKRVGCRHLSAGLRKGLCNVHGDEGLILDYED